VTMPMAVPTVDEPATPLRILIVEDDAAVADLLKRYLEGRGMAVMVVASLAALQTALHERAFDVLLLDLGLPDGDGMAALLDVRAEWKGPLLIISGRAESAEHVLGLELGADDFIDKPFDLREVLARIHAAHRRASVPKALCCQVDGLRIDLQARTVTGRDDQPIALTSGEFDLLAVLLRAPQQSLSRDALMVATRGRAAGPFDRAVDIQIGRLRQKIERDPAQPRLVQSVRGVGYRLGMLPRSGD